MDQPETSASSHTEALKLLPWYVTGELSAADRAMVDAHLIGCEPCRAELRAERAIRGSVATMALDVELGWAAMRQRMTVQPKVTADWWRRAPFLLAAQFVLLVSAVLIFAPFARPAAYHTLSAAPAPAAANALVIFRQDMRQDAVAQALNAIGARIVDGPTEAGALMLHIAPETRVAALGRLKQSGSATLAEPIDP